MNKFFSLILAGAMILGVCGILSGCSWEDEGRSEEKQYQENLMQQSNDAVGMPNITNFYEKKMAKQIFEKRDDSDLICYAYTLSDMSGKYVYIGRCMGYGLPYSTQYTCPESVSFGNATVGYIALPQADPNGLYSPDGLSATWLMMIDDKTGNTYTMYCEPTIIVTENKLPVRLVESFSIAGIDY